MRKKIISLALALVMALTLLPTAAFAEEPATGGTTATASISIDSNSTLWGNAVSAEEQGGTITITVDLAKLNEKANDFKTYLTPHSKYFNYNKKATDASTFADDTNGAQLTLPFSVTLTSDTEVGTVTSTRYKMVESTKTNMDGENGTSPSASSSNDKKTVTEWPVIAFTNLTLAEGKKSVSYTDSTPFVKNDKGATGTLTEWSYEIAWKAGDGSAILTKTVNINLTVTEPDNPDTKSDLTAATVSGAITNQTLDEVKNITVTATAGTAANGVTPVTVTAANIPYHKNADNQDGYWVGFALTAPDGAESLKYKFGTTKDAVSGELTAAALETDVAAGGKKGIAFYANAADGASAKLFAAVQWIGDATHNDSDVTVYQMNIEGVTFTCNGQDNCLGTTHNAGCPKAPVEGALSFEKLTDEGMTASGGMWTDMTNAKLVDGELKIEQGALSADKKSATVTITGILKYASWAAFNGNTADQEQEGHYLPLWIKGGTKDATITVTGHKTKTLTFGDDGQFEFAMFMDKLDGTNGTKGTFTVTSGEITYTIDCTGVVLTPKAEVDGNKITVTVDEKQAETLGNLIKDNGTNVTDTEKAPVVVEGTTNKTLTFTGKDGTSDTVKDSTTVTLPKELVDVVTNDETKADVKVESSAGSVTVPSGTLSGKTDPVTVKVEKATAEHVSSVTIEGKEQTEIADVQTLLDSNATNGVTVTVATDSGNLITAEDDNTVTVVIKVDTANTEYLVLCVSDGKVTSFGVKSSNTNKEISITTKHLSTLIPIKNESLSEDTIAKIPADQGEVVPPIACTYVQSGIFGAQLKLTNLAANSKYVIQMSKAGGYNNAGCVAMIFTTGADETQKVIDVLPSGNGYTVSLFKFKSLAGTTMSDLVTTNLTQAQITKP